MSKLVSSAFEISAELNPFMSSRLSHLRAGHPHLSLLDDSNSLLTNLSCSTLTTKQPSLLPTIRMILSKYETCHSLARAPLIEWLPIPIRITGKFWQKDRSGYFPSLVSWNSLFPLPRKPFFPDFARLAPHCSQEDLSDYPPNCHTAL